jgi:hypothetical protein
MRRRKDSGIGKTLAKVVGSIALAGAGIFAIAQLGSLRRYLRLRMISAKKHATPPGTIPPGADAPPRWGTTHWPLHR